MSKLVCKCQREENSKYSNSSSSSSSSSSSPSTNYWKRTTAWSQVREEPNSRGDKDEEDTLTWEVGPSELAHVKFRERH